MKLYAAFIGIYLISFTANAQSLKPKLDFGTAGNVVTNFGKDGSANAYNSAVQADGKILLGGTLLTRILPGGEPDYQFGIDGIVAPKDAGFVGAVAVTANAKILCSIGSGMSTAITRLHYNGSTDSTFGINGQVEIQSALGTTAVNKIILQPDGKIIVLGILNKFSPQVSYSFFVSRLMSNGSPDLSFNGTGTNFIDLSFLEDRASDIVLQSDGKIVITGNYRTSFNDYFSLFAIRLMANGTRDMGFNNSGIIDYRLPGTGGEGGRLLHIYPDNKILIAGYSNAQIMMMKRLPDGTPDNSFNGNGIVLTPPSNQYLSQPGQLYILPNQKILITGIYKDYPFTSEPDFAAFQYLPSGAPDLSFNGTGFSFFDNVNNEYFAGSAIQPDGSILMYGDSDIEYVQLITSVKMSSNGVFDLSHGTAGVKFALVQNTFDYLRNVLIQPDGKLIAIGTKDNSAINRSNIALIRYNADGTPDNSYGPNGIPVFPVDTFFYASSTLQSDGKLLICGDLYTDQFEVETYIIRLNSNGTIDNSFGTNGMQVLANSLSFYNESLITQSADGKILLACMQNGDPQLTRFYRFNSNGSPDNSFGVNGIKELSLSYPERSIRNLIVQPDGKILLSGDYVINDVGNYYCYRLLANGNTDAGFGQNGFYSNPANQSIHFSGISGIALRPDNKIMMVGYYYEPTGDSVLVSIDRILANGQPDLSFNNSGRAIFYYQNNTGSVSFPEAIAIHPDTSVYIGGTIYVPAPAGETPFDKKFLIWVKNNGSIDSSLSADGTGWHLVEPQNKGAFLTSLKISTDSIIYAAGVNYGRNGDYDFDINALKRLPTAEGRVYTFTGNGSWSTASNWRNNAMPPQPLPNGSVIVIDPSPGSTSIMNVPQSIAPGGNFYVREGSRLIINGNLIINQ